MEVILTGVNAQLLSKNPQGYSKSSSRRKTQPSPSNHSIYSNKTHGGKGLNPKKEIVHLQYKTANPDFTETPSYHGKQQGVRPDSSYTPRYANRSRVRGLSMAAYYGGTEYQPIAGLRSRVLSTADSRYGRASRQLPQLSVLPAPTQLRKEVQLPAAPTPDAMNIPFPTPEPVSVKRVEVTLHEVQQHENNSKLAANKNQQSTAVAEYTKLPPRTATTPRNREESTLFVNPKMINDVFSLPLKPVDLNKSLDIISPVLRKRQNTGKKEYSGAKHAAAKTTFIHKRDIYDRPKTHHLPLKEAYLKPDTLSAREQASRQHHDKTTRIIKWLRNLNYLDEKAVQKGRIEVEKTHYQLPDMKVPVY